MVSTAPLLVAPLVVVISLEAGKVSVPSRNGFVEVGRRGLVWPASLLRNGLFEAKGDATRSENY